MYKGCAAWIPGPRGGSMTFRFGRRRGEMKTEHLTLLATVVIAFAALAALVLTGQAGLRQDLRAVQTAMLEGQAELRKDIRTGQVQLQAVETQLQAVQTQIHQLQAGQDRLRAGQDRLREDLSALGGRLSVVEHRTDALETRFAAVEQRTFDRPAAAGTPASGSDPSASPIGRPPDAASSP